MSVDRFFEVLPETLRHEGGFSKHPRDPGGATNYGITHRTLAAWRGVARVTVDQVLALGRDEAAAIYRSEYWNKVQGDQLRAGLDLVVFDAAVNSGPVRAVQWLQGALRVKVDGVLGPVTLAAQAAAPDLGAVIRRACALRLSFLRGLGHWDAFGRGWARRVAEVEAAALSALPDAMQQLAAELARAKKTQRVGAAAPLGALTLGAAGGGAAVGLAQAVALVAVGVMVALALIVMARRRGADGAARVIALQAAVDLKGAKS
jgi:lysozyme family protein